MEEDDNTSDQNTDKALLKEAKERLKECIDCYHEEREKQRDDLKFSTLEQWPSSIRQERENDVNGARPCLTIDKINQYIQQVVNDFRQNPVSGKIRPVSDDAHDDAAGVFQGVIRNIEDHSVASVAYATAGESAVRIGEGYFRFITEYKDENTFKQKIVIRPVSDAFSVFLGPHKMPDGSDAEYGFIIEDFTEDKFRRLYPKAKYQKTDFELEGDGWRDEDTIRVAEYFYFDYKPKKIVFTTDGKIIQRETYDELPDPKPDIQNERTAQVRSVKWCKLTGAEILEKKDWAGKWIPIVKVIGKEIWVDGKRHCWGLVRPAKDSLRMYNYWASTITEKMALSPKTPYIGAVGQFSGQEERWNSANRVNYPFLEYNPITADGLSVPAPQRQQPAPLETAMIQQMQVIEHDVQTSLGMFKAAMGEERPQQSGKAILALTRESDTGTYHFAANMGISICHGSRIMIDLIPKIYDTEEVMQMLGEDGQLDTAKIDPRQPQAVKKITQPDGSIKKIYNLGIGEYGVTVTVGPSYNTRRMENAALFTDLANSAKDPVSAAVLHYLAVKNADLSGEPDPAELLKVMLPSQVQKVMDKNQEPVPAPVAQRIAQLEQALQLADQQNKELKSGIAETQMKVQAHQQESSAKMQINAQTKQLELAMQKEHDDAQRQLEQQKAAASLEADRLKMQNEMQIAREKAQLDAQIKREAADLDAEVARYKADLEARTKIETTQTLADASVRAAQITAEHKPLASEG